MKNVKKYVVLLQIQSGGTYVFLCMKHLIVAIPFANSIRKKQLLDGLDSRSAKKLPHIIRVHAICLYYLSTWSSPDPLCYI